MSQGRAGSAATVSFNLPDYRVLRVVRDQDGARTVILETLAMEAACPSCGVFADRKAAYLSTLTTYGFRDLVDAHLPVRTVGRGLWQRQPGAPGRPGCRDKRRADIPAQIRQVSSRSTS